ncbi:MAG: hypothetical protein MZV70_20935 [Desulfobacterales bacterium]|nr:hypothetical protein [Desulfobacterales bacterium]
MNMVRGTITLLDPLRNEINIEVAHGISRSAIERVQLQARRRHHRPGHRNRQGRSRSPASARSRASWTAPPAASDSRTRDLLLLRAHQERQRR